MYFVAFRCISLYFLVFHAFRCISSYFIVFCCISYICLYFVQPGKLQELMLHETTVSWIRLRLGKTVPVKPWEETRVEYAARLKMICEDINSNLEVEALCRGFLKRIQKLVDREGGRVKE